MVDSMDLTEVRRSYESHQMHKSDLHADPFTQFGLWLNAANELQVLDATSMMLATSTADGKPSVRVVLLKHYDREGFCWYTDSRSQKGQELAENPHAALLFHWRDFSRQVRLQGRVERLPESEAEDYFHSRPTGSRFSAAASHQSTEISSRSELEGRVRSLQEAHPNGDVPRPQDWIGYRLSPVSFEFWQGQADRLHDRIVYSPSPEGWTKKRLCP